MYTFMYFLYVLLYHIPDVMKEKTTKFTFKLLNLLILGDPAF
ncbi:hypothetical protein CHCC14596_1639 [Bacillus licheniformis]|nr:hypothetical protein CHCC14596_1639 [Bacillus licheniformis]